MVESAICSEMVSESQVPLSLCVEILIVYLGYYIVNVLCVVVGIVTFWGFIKPAAMKLQSLPMRAWRIEG